MVITLAFKDDHKHFESFTLPFDSAPINWLIVLLPYPVMIRYDTERSKNDKQRAVTALKSAEGGGSPESVKMVAMQKTASLWFYESKSIVKVQNYFRLEYRNCRSPSTNCMRRWYEEFQGTGKLLKDPGLKRSC
ncbi:hypothetical protein AVEN_253379-1 [Araneus ventricosus]|uniref:DUF4817 domain-containing protein n=1 Tax=Araneus ventricosus TaxID=182803 RepID=A0A4Y2D0A4_ARAVE|nr:hypothetical protein AVEN_253379-1 [Araneus ventricosus]